MNLAEYDAPLSEIKDLVDMAYDLSDLVVLNEAPRPVFDWMPSDEAPRPIDEMPPVMDDVACILDLPRELRAKACGFLPPLGVLGLLRVSKSFDASFVVTVLDDMFRRLVGPSTTLAALQADLVPQGETGWIDGHSKGWRAWPLQHTHGAAHRCAILCATLSRYVPGVAPGVAFASRMHAQGSLELLLGCGAYELRVVCKGHGRLTVTVDGEPLEPKETEAHQKVLGRRIVQRPDMAPRFVDRLVILDPQVAYLLAAPTSLPGVFECPRWIDQREHPAHIRTLVRGTLSCAALARKHLKFSPSDVSLAVEAVFVVPAGDECVDVPRLSTLIDTCAGPELLPVRALVRCGLRL